MKTVSYIIAPSDFNLKLQIFLSVFIGEPAKRTRQAVIEMKILK